jgi:hypothetical protein
MDLDLSNLIKKVEIRYGGDLIDVHYPKYIKLWNELTNEKNINDVGEDANVGTDANVDVDKDTDLNNPKRVNNNKEDDISGDNPNKKHKE